MLFRSAGWLLPSVPAADGLPVNRLPNPLSALLIWKIIDNLRRSLVPIAFFMLMLGSIAIATAPNTAWLTIAFVLAILYLPACLNGLLTLTKKPKESTYSAHLKLTFQSTYSALLLPTLQLIFLPFEMAINIDAIINHAVLGTVAIAILPSININKAIGTKLRLKLSII